MKGAAESLGRQTSGRLNRRASEIFSELTGGRYRESRWEKRWRSLPGTASGIYGRTG